ncbi:peptidase S1 domain-containing protein [Caerostris darwini]|uniref:Peptidase S1 domain-containing protein n=1 Tax=Caerostris darwini TaxID=1538125 RepID=A0AAV4R007_9ARAC|nr:peptidase S1 domain-containing protein [Caerostris darwini]
MNQMNEPVMHQSDLHEVHYETPMISILSRNISVYKTDYRSMRMRRSLDDKHEINASESLQQNDLKQNKSLEVKTNSPYPIVYEYEYMVDKIETLIKRIGGMKVICKDYPELAYILTMELNKTCPSSVISLNITNFIDSNTEWSSTTDVGEHLEMKQDSNSTINMRKRRNSESNDWKDLYFLSREYLREILEMLVSEKYGDSVSKDSISKINLHRPFSSEELKLLLLGDFTSGVKNLTFEAYMKNIDQYLGSRKLSVSSSHSSKESNLTQSMKNSSSGSSKTVKGSAGIHSEHADESKFSEEVVHFRGSLKNENKENHLEHDSQNAPNHNCNCHMEDVVKEKQTAKNISHSSNSDNKTGETLLKYRNKQEDFKMVLN